jgi:hypothetical protein
MYSLIVTCKLNDVDPQARLADVLARIARTSGDRGFRPLPPGRYEINMERAA